MYQNIIRPLLFLIPPETIHNIISLLLRIFFAIPCFKALSRCFFTIKSNELRRKVAGIEFANPVGMAAGFDKNGKLYNELAVFGFSFVEIGTITPRPQPGNKKPRSFRLVRDKALVNRMGFNSEGVESVIKRLRKKRKGLIIGGNIGKNSTTPNERAVNDYEACFNALYEHIDYFVVNVSCPNVNNLTELQDASSLEEIIERLVHIRKEKEDYRPVFLKISPDLDFEKLDNIIGICKKNGIDGIVATNTTISREGLRTGKERIEKIGAGGLSGAPLKDRSTEIIRYIKKQTKGEMPVIGVGGILNARDAIEKIEAGATLVQLYTGFIYEGPFLVKSINKAILKRSNQ
jgi:dihydroorotate dehydrogenase